MDQNRYDEAYRDFKASSELGDKGFGMYNIGAMYYLVGKSQQSLDALSEAERQGYDLFGLHYQRGVALFDQGNTAEAINSLSTALNKNPPSPMRQRIQSAKGQMELKAGNADAAIADLMAALQADPKMADTRLKLAMAYVAKRDYGGAEPVFSGLLAEGENASAYFGRAVAHFGLSQKAAAVSDIENAIRLDPNNPSLTEWRTKIQAMP
jgi:tetratricopeptide (TPR) repeat protein